MSDLDDVKDMQTWPESIRREHCASKPTLPDWMAGLTHKDWLFDGSRCTEEQWRNLDWDKAYVDLGPSVAGNLGPYWHVPHCDGDTAHRLYPKLLQTKWLNVVRQAATEFADRAVRRASAPPALIASLPKRSENETD
jgi:hypothetical protein